MAENTSDKFTWIIDAMPYGKGFLFVDEIISIDENSIEAHFTFREDFGFYRDHFKDNPVTPGVILTECMAQIGLVAFGLYNYIDKEKLIDKPRIALSSSNVDFYQPVYPKQRVVVKAVKQYFRFGKLKCLCKMYDKDRKLICKGEIAGMIESNKNA